MPQAATVIPASTSIPLETIQPAKPEIDAIAYVDSLPCQTWKTWGEKNLATGLAFFFPNEPSIPELAEFTNTGLRQAQRNLIKLEERGIVKLRRKPPKIQGGGDTWYVTYNDEKGRRQWWVGARGSREVAVRELKSRLKDLPVKFHRVAGCALNVPDDVSIIPISPFNRALIEFYANLLYGKKTVDNFLLRTFAHKVSAPNREYCASHVDVGCLLGLRNPGNRRGNPLGGKKGALRRVEKYLRHFVQYEETGDTKKSLWQLADKHGRFADQPKMQRRPQSAESLWRMKKAGDIVGFRPPLKMVYAPSDFVEGPKEKKTEFRHSEDFRSIVLNGESFTLTTKEAQVIQMLKDACDNGMPDVSGEIILERINSGKRLRDVFPNDRRKLYYKLIRPGERRGTYRLNW